MRLTIIGGGGFRVPLILDAVRRAAPRVPIDEVVLQDPDRSRLDVIEAVSRDQSAPFAVHTTTDLDASLDGASMVFSAMRVGGAAGRVRDERGAMAVGLLGQETVGAGGLTYALRTVPAVDELARAVALRAPRAWVISFTNPAGLVTEAMRAHHERVVGICDTPIGLVRRTLRAAGLPPEAFDTGAVAVDYAGVNHLGWLRGLRVRSARVVPGGAPGAGAADGGGGEHGGGSVDLLPALLADDAALVSLEEVRLVGVDWVRACGALPNEYLYYYLHARRARAAMSGAGGTRGDDVAREQHHFFAAASARPADAAKLWRAALARRDTSYMAIERAAEGAGERDAADLGGGYHDVAVDLMAALLGGAEHRMILDVPNRAADATPVVPGLDTDAVVEVPVLVRRDAVTPAAMAHPPEPADVALMAQVKAAERLMIRAARSTGAQRELLAWRALAAHPLVDDLDAARHVVRAALAGDRAGRP